MFAIILLLLASYSIMSLDTIVYQIEKALLEKLDAAFGLAKSSEVELYNDYEAVISLADAGMYDYKKKSKLSRTA